MKKINLYRTRVRIGPHFINSILMPKRRRIQSITTTTTAVLYNVRHIPWAKKLGQGQPCAYRFARLSAPLFNHRYDVNVIFIDRNNPPICRQSDRLRTHKGHSRGRAQHILLDSFNVRTEEFVQKKDWQRSSVSGYRQFRRQTARSKSVQVLSVGVLLSLLSGNFNVVCQCFFKL